MRRRRTSRVSKIAKTRQAKRENLGIYMSENYWLVPKPYDTFGKTDTFYFEIANRVYEALLPQKEFLLHGGMIDTYLHILSCNLTSYFEDRMSGLGFWQSFIDTNLELYDYALPFYDLAQYNPKSINVQDIYYLLWHRLTKERAEFVPPEATEILAVGKAIFSIFEKNKNSAKKNPNYEEILTLKSEEQQVVSIRFVLQWLSIRSYMNGADLAISYQEDRQKLIEEKRQMLTDEEASYLALEEYAYMKRSSFSAMSSTDVLAKIAQISLAKKEGLKNLERYLGYYQYKDSDKDCYIFEHVRTSKTYRVEKSSFQPFSLTSGQIFFTSFIPWDGKWFLSSVLQSIDKNSFWKAEKEKPLQNKTFLTTTQKEKIKANIQNEHQVFLDTFETSLVFYTTQKEFRKDIILFYNNVKKSTETLTTEQIEDRIDILVSTLEIEEFGVFFDDKTGIEFVYKIPSIIELLKKPQATAEDIQKLFTFFVRKEMSYSFLEYLLAHYPTDNLQFPDTAYDFDVPKYLHFLRRFYHPDDFGRHVDLPSLSLVDYRVEE